MDYSADPWWVYLISIVVVFGAAIGLPFWGIYVSSRRARRQSLSIENGALHVVDSAFGGPRSLPFDRLGTAVYLPPIEASTAIAPITSVPLAASDTAAGQDYRNTQARATGNGASMFRYGGLIILDTKGRMAAHVEYEVGSNAPLGTVWQQIPAPNHVQVPTSTKGGAYSRREFKKAYPRALRFGQFWGAARWTWTILGCVFIGLPVLGFIALFVAAFIVTLNQTNG